MKPFLTALFLFILTLSLGHTASPPSATANLRPDPAYTDSRLRGGAVFQSPGSRAEGASTYRWLRGATEISAGVTPQTLLLPLDGSLVSTDGLAPVENQGVSFVSGKYGQALQFSPSAGSRLAYSSAGKINPNEGSLALWVNLSHDLGDPAYDTYPRLFSYVIDGEHQLYIEANQERIILTSRNTGQYYGAWPDPPAWKAGEWHHLAVTWSTSAGQIAVYYDCVQASASSEYPSLAGSAAQFNLGSAGGWGAIDAVLDDVQISRRALAAEEIAAVCQRGGPAANDEVMLTSTPLTAGDPITFELTPCDADGACGAPSSASLTISDPPLAPLDPPRGLLPAGTTSLTLKLSTAEPADCRWSLHPETPYSQMAGPFQQGQGTTAHTAVVSGFQDLDDRWFYVRCADAQGPRSPDDYERSTHLRILGPWNADYPRLANIWGSYDGQHGTDFFANYDLFVASGWGEQGNQAAAIRASNPNAKILLSQDATYSNPAWDPLTRQWMESQPDDEGYNCVLRDTAGQVLLVEYWGHPMYNMTEAACREILARRSTDNFLSSSPSAGDNLAYDGIYWDRLHDTISWLSPNIDSNLDGLADDPAALDAAYLAGMKDFFTRLRSRLPSAVLMGNDGPQVYAPWINGRLYEWQLATILDGASSMSWNEIIDSYRDWSGRGSSPHTTFIESAPEDLFSKKYTFQHLDQAPAAMEAEAAASYARMRYGLTSALMGDGLFSYDYGADWHGNPWWYDEFGWIASQKQALSLPPPGYLGQPQGQAALLSEPLSTPDQVANGSFSNGLSGWNFWVNTGAGAAASLAYDPSGGVTASGAAHITVTQPAQNGQVELNQPDITTTANQVYTLSFWARSSVPLSLDASVIKQSSPWTHYGFTTGAVQVTSTWQRYILTDDASVSAADGKLEFLLGDAAGEVWLDDIQFQEGAAGVWARPYEHGLAVINTSKTVQNITLPDTYCKLHGRQAPLFQVRVDDDQAVGSGWEVLDANFNQFGATVHQSSQPASLIYTPDLAYAGKYEVLAWVAPQPGLSQAAPVILQHGEGQSQVFLDESSGEPGWRSLGIYSFAPGSSGYARIEAGPGSPVTADAFKWISAARYNDGSLVNQLTLQPQDGILLLSQCYRPPAQIYLPAVIK